MADLRWLGLGWDEGPDIGGPCGPYRQSERLARHRAAADDLLAAGLAYHCFCPEERLEELRREALAAGRTPRYDRRCLALPAGEVRRRLDAGEPAAVRFQVPAGEVVVDDLIRGRVVIGADALSDPIIVRSDGVAGYNFATVVDDRDMGITHVIRGDDHLTNTARQQLLFEALGGPVPAWAHHSMVLGRTAASSASVTAPPRWATTASSATCRRRSSTTWRCWAGRTARTRCSSWTGWCASSSSSGCRRARRCSTSPSSTGSTTSASWRSRRRSTSAASRSGCRPGRRRRRRPRSRPRSSRRWCATATRRPRRRSVLAPAPPPDELRALARAAVAAARARARAAREGAGVAHARRRPRAPRRLPRLGQGARHRRPRPAHAAAHRPHVRRAWARAAVRARRARPRDGPRPTRPHPRRERCR